MQTACELVRHRLKSLLIRAVVPLSVWVLRRLDMATASTLDELWQLALAGHERPSEETFSLSLSL